MRLTHPFIENELLFAVKIVIFYCLIVCRLDGLFPFGKNISILNLIQKKWDTICVQWLMMEMRVVFLAYRTRISASTFGAGKLYLTPPCKTGRVR